MHFQMKIQPIDNRSYGESVNCEIPTVKPVLRSRLKRLFDRQFPSVLKNNSETVTGAGEVRDAEFEPSSVCLAKMVQNFIEDAVPEKPKCGRSRCNCFNGNFNDVSDDEFDLSASDGDSSETLKSLTLCPSVIQRNLLAECSKIVEKNKTHKRKDELRKIVAEELTSMGYDASICKSRWEKSSSSSSSYPAGEYEYVDVIFEDGDRVIIDIDFRSEFEIARPTGIYKGVLQSLPYIFVGDSDRLQQILSVVSEAGKQSLKKKGMPVPPWRKFEYMRAKWVSAHVRLAPSPLTPMPPPTPPPTPDATAASKQIFVGTGLDRKEPAPEFETECGVFELIFGEETTSLKSVKTSPFSIDGILPLRGVETTSLQSVKTSQLSMDGILPLRGVETTSLQSVKTSQLSIDGVLPLSVSGEETTSLLSIDGVLPEKKSGDGIEVSPVGTWQPPALKPRSKLVVTGLASLFREKA